MRPEGLVLHLWCIFRMFSAKFLAWLWTRLGSCCSETLVYNSILRSHMVSLKQHLRSWLGICRLELELKSLRGKEDSTFNLKQNMI